jgi:hypothetical protein
MIYDCFTFFNELDLLELRFELLNKHVDWFVLSESPKTHSGKEKLLYFKNNRERYKRFLHKIIYIEADEFPLYRNSWSYENYQRNSLVNGLKNCSDNDIILISDLDEIPKLESLPSVVKDGEVICFLQEMYYYYINNYKENQLIWEGGTKAVTFLTIKKNLLNDKYVQYNNNSFNEDINKGASFTKIRLYRHLKLINNGGWHLSYMGGVELISIKLSATSHQEINTNEINSKDYILKCLESGCDLLNPQIKNYTVKINNFPKEFFQFMPSKYFLKSTNHQNIIKYNFNKFYELFLINLRNIVRGLILYFK